MPDNKIPAANPGPEAQPGEFDFAKPIEENPRVQRRSLKVKPPVSLKPATGAPQAARELAREAPPLSARETAPESRPGSGDDEAETTEVKTAEPSPARPASAPPKSTPTQPASPHGTRPATLYYSTSVRKEKEETSPMKSTPTASPASSTSAPLTSPARPAASSLRPASVVDYRTNVERQAREQKSVGGLLSILVYALIGLFVLGAVLAGYGAYVVHQALHDQSVTVSQLDARYSAENKDLNTRLAATMDTLSQAQAQIAREQDLIVKQQETINKLLATTQETASAVRQEKQTRAEETASLRARVKDLEYQEPGTRKY